MRAKRLRALVGGAILTASERRLMKRQFYAARSARGGFSSHNGRGIMTDTAMANGDRFRPERLTRALKDVFRRLTPRTQYLVAKLLAGKYNWRGQPVLGTGEASRLSRPALKERVETLLRFNGIKNYVEV